MQMDGRSSHWASAVCLHAACQYTKHEATLTQNRRAAHAALYREMDFSSVDGSVG